jgi:PadR family transcriptional regulator, regulatory protein PadR
VPESETQLSRGTLHVLILRRLAGGPLHGYAIATEIADRSGGLFALEDGALYQALHRMEERGWLASEWGHADNGKRARFYRLTDEGRRRLRIETASWIRYARAVFQVLEEVET